MVGVPVATHSSEPPDVSTWEPPSVRLVASRPVTEDSPQEDDQDEGSSLLPCLQSTETGSRPRVRRRLWFSSRFSPEGNKEYLTTRDCGCSTTYINDSRSVRNSEDKSANSDVCTPVNTDCEPDLQVTSGYFGSPAASRLPTRWKNDFASWVTASLFMSSKPYATSP